MSFRADGPHRYEAVGGPVESVLLLQYPGDVHAQHLGAGCVSTSRGVDPVVAAAPTLEAFILLNADLE